MICSILFWILRNPLCRGEYDSELNPSILRHVVADKDMRRGDGIRVPIGNRGAHAGAALAWGALLDGVQSDESLLLADCWPFAADAFDAIVPEAKKLAQLGKQPVAIGRFRRRAKQSNNMFFFFIYGEQSR